MHVYVEERTAGIVVTIEDSGLKMAGAALRRAEEAVSGRVTDLAHLQGTRLGLTVVGRLAAKYGMSVSFRPSSRGGTGWSCSSPRSSWRSRGTRRTPIWCAPSRAPPPRRRRPPPVRAAPRPPATPT
ncbi:hypothetical protein ACFQ60_11570 [Streptomyces zhihengii]